MAAIVTGFTNVFRDLGTREAVIRQDEHSSQFLSSIFILNIVFSGTLTAVILLASGWASSFFSEPRLCNILRILAVTVITSGAASLPLALLQHRLEFRRLAVVEVTSVIAGGLTGTILAFWNFGVWSIVGQTLTTSTIACILAYQQTAYQPSLQFSFSEIRVILKFSGNLTLFNFLNYFVRNADNLLIGKFLGSEALGIYSLAYRLMLIPLQNVTSVVTKVMFPVLSKLNSNTDELRRTYLKMTVCIAFLTFPLMAGASVVAQEAINVLFAPTWAKAGVILNILAPLGLLQSVCSPVGVLYLVRGRTDLMFRWGLLSSGVTLIAMLAGLRFGLVGIAIAYLTASLALLIPSLLIPFHLVGLSSKEFAWSLRRIATCALLMAIMVAIAQHVTNGLDIPEAGQLLSSVMAGILTYTILVVRFAPAETSAMQSFLLRIIKKPKSSSTRTAPRQREQV